MTKRIGLLLFIVVLLVSIPATLAQAIPPRLIATNPPEYLEAAPSQPLMLSFDQAMDAASVEAALTFIPDISGTFFWSNDRTVSFTPQGGWQRGTVYTVTLSSTAQSQNGTPLESTVNLTLTIGGTLHVALISPEPDTRNVDTEEVQLVVAFDRPIIPLGSQLDAERLPVALMVDPPVEGYAQWLNTSVYMLTVAGRLTSNTNYTITIPAGLTAMDGSVLDEAVTSTFRTASPRVEKISPSDFYIADKVLLDTSFTVKFSEPVVQETYQTLFELRDQDGKTIDGSFTWNAQRTEMTFTPHERLANGTDYEVILSDANGLLSQMYTQKFTTVGLPQIIGTSPQEGSEQRWLNTIYFYVNTPLKPETIRVDRFRIEPKPIGNVIVEYKENFRQIELNFAHQDDSAYTVTVLSGIEDIYGNPLPEHTLTYSIMPEQPQAHELFWAQIPSDFVIAATSHGNPQLPLAVDAEIKALDIYRTPIDELAASDYEWTFHQAFSRNTARVLFSRYDSTAQSYIDITPSWLTEANRVAHLPYKPQRNFAVTHENGETLEPGLYTVEIQTADEKNRHGILLAVSNVSITLKNGRDSILLWVTDLETGRPVEGVTVSNWTADGETLLGTTDADGVVYVTQGQNIGYVIAQGDDIYGAWHEISFREYDGYYYGYDDYGPSIPRTGFGYLYTDRPIYRPGDTVYFRGVLRDGIALDYQIPERETVFMTAAQGYYYYDEPSEPPTPIYTDTVNVSDFGTISGSFVIPPDVPLSPNYLLQVKTCNVDDEGCTEALYTTISFEVSEFRVPEFEASTVAQQDEIINGETINAIVTSKYYYGSPLSNAGLTWRIYSNGISTFRYTGAESGYTFSPLKWEYPWFDRTNEGTLSTDERGQHLISQMITIPDMGRPLSMTVESTVTDETGQAISSRDSFLVHAGEVYVGMRTALLFGNVDQSFNIDLLTVDTESIPVGDKTVTLDINKITYERQEGESAYFLRYKRIETPVKTGIEVTTEANGKAVYPFIAPDAGTYEIHARVEDSEGRLNYSGRTIYVSDRVTTQDYDWLDPFIYADSCSYTPEPLKLRLMSDATRYNPGDTAHILIPNPYKQPVTALITVERSGVMSAESVTIEGDTYTYDLAITDEHAPTVYVAVVLMRSVTDDDLNPAAIRGDISLSVDPSVYRLNIDLKPSQEVVRPGETLSFDVRLTDRDGQPIKGEVGLGLTDDAIFALRPENSGSLESLFYGPQSLEVSTSIAIRALLGVPVIDNSSGCGGGGEGDMQEEMEAPTVRSDFVTTPLWAAHVVTDENGEATVSVDMPDNLTRWRLDARAVTADTMVGQNRLMVTSYLPLMVRAVTPRFFVAGDRMPLAAVVNNNTDEQQTVVVQLEATGLDINGETSQTVTIPPQGRARIEWDTLVLDVAGIDVTVSAVAESGLGDATKPTLTTNPDGTIPVYRFTAPETVSTGGVLDAAMTTLEGVSLPQQVSDVSGELLLNFNPSLAGVTLDSLDYVRNFPHQCIEQTVSRFLPNVVTFRTLRDFGLENAELEQNLTTALDFGLKKLQDEQNADGGWGWFGGMESHAYVTAYALLGLIEARDAGYAIDVGMMERATAFLKTQMPEEIEVNTASWMLDRWAFIAYVMARLDDTNITPLLEMLFETRSEMAHSGRAFLLMAYLNSLSDADAVDTLVSDFVSSATYSANSVSWHENGLRYWWNWDSDTRTTALVLLALSKADADNPLLPGVVRWLVQARRADHWATTQETAWAVIALTSWMQTSGELNPAFDYTVLVNQTEVASARVDSFDQTQRVSIDVRDLLRDTLNTLTITRGEGDGRLYYTSTLKLDLPASEVDAASRGVIITREYHYNDVPMTPIDEIVVGEIVTVRLSLIVTQDMFYFALEDKLPAGLEVLDARLMTTTTAAQSRFRRVQYGNPYWFYGYVHFDRTEMRDTGAHLYADYLPRGSYIFSYKARAVAPGEFQVIPAQAYAFYQPEIYGRTEGLVFTVHPAEMP